jgi:hypothetical protein
VVSERKGNFLEEEVDEAHAEQHPGCQVDRGNEDGRLLGGPVGGRPDPRRFGRFLRHVSRYRIVNAAIVGRQAAFQPARRAVQDLRTPEFDVVAVEVLAAWFLDYGYFRFSFEQAKVALLFGTDPVAVEHGTGTRLAVAAAQFLCGYEEEDAAKRSAAAPLAALSIKESMWGSPLPEEWI